MSIFRVELIALACALGAEDACTKPAPSHADTAVSQADASEASDGGDAVPVDCGKIFS
jgi:hypothetical protein